MNRYIYTKLLAAATTLLFNFLDERNRVILIANENNPSDRSSLNVKKKGREREGKKANAHFALPREETSNSGPRLSHPSRGQTTSKCQCPGPQVFTSFNSTWSPLSETKNHSLSLSLGDKNRATEDHLEHGS